MNLTFEEAAEYSGIGINKLRDLGKETGCPFILYIGNKKLIKRKLFEKYIENQTQL
jgi:Excisionase from transposon Tn916.